MAKVIFKLGLSTDVQSSRHYKSSSLFLGGNKLLGKWTPHFVSYVGLVHFQGQGCARSEIQIKTRSEMHFKASCRFRADSFLALQPWMCTNL